MTAPLLEASHLSATYPRAPRPALVDATFSLDRYASAALVGPSGSGKSTLLLAIAGVIPSEGRLVLDGRDLDGVPTHEREIGVVFQDGQLFSHLTVEGNIEFGLAMRRWSRARRRERVEELLSLVGLEGFGPRPVTELSGGERQRIALARTLAPRPRIVLLDEPLSALDADLRARLAHDLRSALEAAGSSWIVVTHDRAEASSLADTVWLMRDGVLDYPH